MLDCVEQIARAAAHVSDMPVSVRLPAEEENLVPTLQNVATIGLRRWQIGQSTNSSTGLRSQPARIHDIVLLGQQEFVCVLDGGIAHVGYFADVLDTCTLTQEVTGKIDAGSSIGQRATTSQSRYAWNLLC